jgi:PAS domain S-box-containing protein
MNLSPEAIQATDLPLPGNNHHIEELIAEQGLILEMISGGKELPEILNAIVLWAEKESRDELMASILLVDEANQKLLHGAAPSLPEEYNKAIHGVSIAYGIGSCGTAAFTGEPVMVDDIETNPLWKDFKDLALSFGLKACWSIPLKGRNNKVLGTFAMYYRKPKTTSSYDLQVLRLISSTAMLAIEWKKSEDEKEQLLANERRANEKVKEERQRFYQLLMQSPAMVAVLSGPEHVFELANMKYMEAVGVQREILGKPVREALPEVKGQGLFELLDNVYKTGEPFVGNEIKVRINKNDKGLEDIYFNFVYQAILDENNNPEGIFVHAVDVTDLVKAKLRAQKSEEMFRSYVMNAPTPIGIYTGREMRIQTANDAILKAWEKDRSVVGRTFREALPELEGQPFFQLLDEVYTTGKTYEAKEERVDLLRDGKITPTFWNFTYKAIRNEVGEIYGVMNTAAEITDLVIAKQKLAEAEEILRSAIDIAELGTWSMDLEEHFISSSDNIVQWFGMTAPVVTLEETLSRIHQDDRETVVKSIQKAIETHGIYEAEYRVINPETKRERVLHAKGLVTIDENNRKASLNGVCRDITLQRQIEKELAKEVEKRTFELKQANNELNSLNENLKQFVYIASHDLQEPLRKINMFSDLLRKKAADGLDESAKNFLLKITQASQRMTNLIKDLLDFSRADAGEKRFVEIDLNVVLTNVVEDFDMLIQQKNAIVKVNHLPTLDAIPVQMNQLFYNLIGNALKFAKNDVQPVIEVSSRRLEANEVDQYEHLNRNWDYQEIIVQDNGIGFNQQFADQIFIMFQRLHAREQFDGTGIGLALCKKIVDNHNGVIYAVSQENEGAGFHLILPVRRQ